MLAQLKTDDTTAVFGHIKGRAATQIKNGPAKLAFFSRLHNGQPSGKTLKFYGCGQGPSRLCLEKESFSPLGLVKWMTIGAMQMAVYFPLALLSLPFENAFHMKCLRKGCEGAGKFFWQSPFRPKLYGQAAVDNLKKELS